MLKCSPRLVLLLGLLLPAAAYLWLKGGTTRPLSTSLTEWDFGLVAAADTPETTIVISNPNAMETRVVLLVSCQDLQLSQSRFLLEPGGEQAVTITPNRQHCGTRQGAYTIVDTELVVSSDLDQVAEQTVAIRGRFYEPFSFDRDARRAWLNVVEPATYTISISAADQTVGKPRVVQLPDFVQAVDVQWNDDFNAGDVVLQFSQGQPPGLYVGEILMVDDSSSDELLFAIPAELHLSPPCRVEPAVVFLGGMTRQQSQTVSLGFLPGVQGSLIEVASATPLVTLDKSSDTTAVARLASDAAGGDFLPVNDKLSLTVQWEQNGRTSQHTLWVPVSVSQLAAQSIPEFPLFDPQH